MTRTTVSVGCAAVLAALVGWLVWLLDAEYIEREDDARY